MVFFKLKTEEETQIYQQELAKYAKLIGSAVNFTWHAWERTEAKSFEEKAHYPVVVLALTRHVCEELGAVGVLAAQGYAEACKLPLRSTFEAMLGIQFILKADSERRGIAYQVAHARRRIAEYKRLDLNEETGRKLRADLKNDPLAAGLAWPADTKPMVANLETLLASSDFAPINAEWQRMRGTGKKKKVAWFALFGGPADVEQLAKHLDRAAAYEFLYRDWSNAVHAGDCLRNFGKKTGGKPGEVAIKPVQHPEGLGSMIALSLGICVLISRLLLERWGTEELREAAQADWIARFQPGLHAVINNGLTPVSSWR